jgi:hypothetical protein
VKQVEIAVLGAGPYGLAATAHLRAAGFDVRLFGEPMNFWHKQMPEGMMLRSPWAGSHISDPERKFTLDAYRQASGQSFSSPIPLKDFVEYGRWFQNKVAPDLDSRSINRVAKNGSFQLTLADGEKIHARHVVIAAGIGAFTNIPPAFAHLPAEFASHTTRHADFTQFSGKHMVVVGSGQSALESAALLHEAGAEVEVIARAPAVIWLRRVPILHKVRALERLLFAPPDVGPAGISHLVAHPECFRLIPQRIRQRLGIRCIRPAGASWLRPRLRGVTITTGRAIVSAERVGQEVVLRLDDGSVRRVHHVLLATGFNVNIAKYDFVAPEVLRAISQTGGFPRLAPSFESSVQGLYFIGATSAWSFGPLMRFVAGTEFAARTLTRGIGTAHVTR